MAARKPSKLLQQLFIPEVDPKHEGKVKRAQMILNREFYHPGLLQVALTHPSYAKHAKTTNNYERMEFLGDSILGAIIAEEVFARYPDLEEGGLTRIKVSVVSGASLSKVCGELGLGECIIFGDSEAGTQGRGLHSALENVYEAIVAALYLDGGWDVARDWVMLTLGPHISHDIATEPESPKSSLQEYLQARKRKPTYRITDIIGPPHDRVFQAAVYCDDELLGTGEGHSKKAAEAAAAQVALEKIAEQKANGRRKRRERKAEQTEDAAATGADAVEGAADDEPQGDDEARSEQNAE